MTHILLEQYVKLTEFLGKALGPDYEIALHDLTNKNQSIIAIANGHISGRTIGAPLTNVALQIIAEGSYKTADCRLNYSGMSTGNKHLRSSTLFIKDENGKLIGLLCINFDDSRYREVSQNVLRLCHPDLFVDKSLLREALVDENEPVIEEPEPTESFHNTIAGVTDDAVAQVISEYGVAPDRLTQDEKMEIVGALFDRGVFMLKGAVKDVSEALRCSPASVYRYLTRVRAGSREKGESE